MNKTSYLLLRKGTETKNSYTDFGFATGEIEFPAKTNVKEFAVTDCPGEDGERVYFQSQSYLSAYDLDVDFKYVGELTDIYDHYKSFRDYLTGRDGKGTEFEIYSPWHRIGRKGVRLKDIEEDKYIRDDLTACLCLKVKFRVTDPVTDVLLSN